MRGGCYDLAKLLGETSDNTTADNLGGIARHTARSLPFFVSEKERARW